MRVVMVMFDSLNRRFLSPYGCDWTHTPNFARLARRAVTFDSSYVCSMPCMPARRDLHTARPNFLHRSWGPIEPFDDSMPQILKQNGVYSHLCTDHQHYWEDGGATYHQRYSTFELVRGQEGDKWQPLVKGVAPQANAMGRNTAAVDRDSDDIHWQDRVNRHFMPTEADHPQSRTFAAGLRFIDLNKDADNWFLQLETFDPHEPFFVHDAYKALYPQHYQQWQQTDGRQWDWPGYEPVDQRHTPALIDHVRHEYAALLSMCDAKLGQVLDAFDRYDLWKDTMLIVWTDHGFLLGEHDWWAKMMMPWWNELANTPFLVWDPRHPAAAGSRRTALVQPSIDLAPTVLGFFGIQPTTDMLGRDLTPVIATDTAVRDSAIFGVHGAHVNVTDGRYVYMRGPTGDNTPLFDYTLMPTHMKSPFSPAELSGDRVALTEPFSFMKGCRVMKITTAEGGWQRVVRKFGTLLYDLHSDPGQTMPIDDPAIEAMMIGHLVRQMRACDAPPEQYQRLGLKPAAGDD